MERGESYLADTAGQSEARIRIEPRPFEGCIKIPPLKTGVVALDEKGSIARI
jgi:hypothetical protein